MKGVVLAGGTGSRLMPLTKVTNKHLLPVYNRPMIYYPLETLIAAGTKEIMIVSGRGHAGHFLDLLGSGADKGIRLSYEVQETAGGIAQALSLAESFADEGNVAVVLGDNIFERQEEIIKAVADFAAQGRGAKILLKEVADPQRFGVAEISGGKVIGIEEKPKIPKSHFCVTGFYLYDQRVFGVIKTLKPSARGELEITDVNNFYIAEGTMTYQIIQGEWTDAGTFDSLFQANQLVYRQSHLKVI